MNAAQRTAQIQRLLSTSVDDCVVDLKNQRDTHLLCDLLIECHVREHHGREQAVRRRIAQLVRGER